jgi:predicted deacylase
MKRAEHIPLPAASPGTSRAITVLRYGKSGAHPKAYLQAGLHADEAPGYVVLHHLVELLDQAAEREDITGEIVVVPAANPLGLAQWRDESLQGRFDFANSINFNRDHSDLAEAIAEEVGPLLGQDPEKNIGLIRTSATKLLADAEPQDEAASLKRLLLSLSHDSDVVLDLHCDLQALMHVYTGESLWPDALDLSAQVGAEATLLADDSGGTPFDEANSRLWWALAEKFQEHPIPPACLSATVELRGISDTAPDTARNDAKNLFHFLQRRGFISGDAPDLPPLLNEATPLTGVDYVKAQAPGIVTYLKMPGDFVRVGETIAEIINPLPEQDEQKVCPVKSTTDGLLFSINVDRFARPGRILAKVAGSEPLREGDGNLLTL